MMGMENLGLLIEALEFIEKNLASPIRTESISEHLHCSKSTIEKLFKYVNNISIRDYIIRRRMSRYRLRNSGKIPLSLNCFPAIGSSGNYWRIKR